MVRENRFRRTWYGITPALCLFLLCITQHARAQDNAPPAQGASRHSPGAPQAAFVITSTAFNAGDAIPLRFTCDGSNISPLLAWTQPPSGTQSFVLIMDDPDAPRGDWVHWVMFDIPDGTSGLPDNLPPVPEMQTGARQGMNSYHRFGYSGPCPPKNKEHHYFFRLYALDQRLGLMPGALKMDVERAMQGHVLAKAELMGRYER
jgi:Raf kinase inhibitor-like YbhB/YbcL family protein